MKLSGFGSFCRQHFHRFIVLFPVEPHVLAVRIFTRLRVLGNRLLEVGQHFLVHFDFLAGLRFYLLVVDWAEMAWLKVFQFLIGKSCKWDGAWPITRATVPSKSPPDPAVESACRLTSGFGQSC